MKTTKVVLMIPYFAPGSVTLKKVLNLMPLVLPTLHKVVRQIVTERGKNHQGVRKSPINGCHYNADRAKLNFPKERLKYPDYQTSRLMRLRLGLMDLVAVLKRPP